MKKEEGHYTIKVVDRLPKRGNSNWLYSLKKDNLSVFYFWTLNNNYEKVDLANSISSGSISIEAGKNVELLGTGAISDPYILSAVVPTYTVDNNANTIRLLSDGVVVSTVDLSLYLDDTNLARLVNGTLDSSTGIATFTRDDSSTFTVDFSSLLSNSTFENGITENSGVVRLGSDLIVDTNLPFNGSSEFSIGNNSIGGSDLYAFYPTELDFKNTNGMTFNSGANIRLAALNNEIFSNEGVEIITNVSGGTTGNLIIQPGNHNGSIGAQIGEVLTKVTNRGQTEWQSLGIDSILSKEEPLTDTRNIDLNGNTLAILDNTLPSSNFFVSGNSLGINGKGNVSANIGSFELNSFTTNGIGGDGNISMNAGGATLLLNNIDVNGQAILNTVTAGVILNSNDTTYGGKVSQLNILNDKAFRYNLSGASLILSDDNDIPNKKYIDEAIATVGGGIPNLNSVLSEGGNITGNNFSTITGASLWQINGDNGLQLLLDNDEDEIVFGNVNNMEILPKIGGSLLLGRNASTTIIGNTTSDVNIQGNIIRVNTEGGAPPSVGQVLTALDSTGRAGWQDAGSTLSAWTNLTLEGDASALRARYRTKENIVELDIYGLRMNSVAPLSGKIAFLPNNVAPNIGGTTASEDTYMFINGFNLNNNPNGNSYGTALIGVRGVTTSITNRYAITLLSGAVNPTDFLVFHGQYEIL